MTDRFGWFVLGLMVGIVMAVLWCFAFEFFVEEALGVFWGCRHFSSGSYQHLTVLLGGFVKLVSSEGR